MYVIKLKNKRLFYLDQTKLPLKEIWRECKNAKDGYKAIGELRIRGAPLIGVFAAYCIAVSCRKFSSSREEFLRQLNDVIVYLRTSRPTAVNLFWALERIKKVVTENKGEGVLRIKRIILEEAKAIHQEDSQLCSLMADYGLSLVEKGDRILVYCNTGFLATSGEGTALAVIYKAHRVYKNIKVFVSETRPLLQGARLTSWELAKEGVPSTLICDNMVAFLMQKGEIDKVFVGADRIVSNGDIANKIGTYNIAILAHYHKIPFYVVAPFSSFDLKLEDGSSIPIEERSEDEIRKVLHKVSIAPGTVKAWNPAFDITPNHLISAIVTDRGIIYPPYENNIKMLLRAESYFT